MSWKGYEEIPKCGNCGLRAKDLVPATASDTPWGLGTPICPSLDRCLEVTRQRAAIDRGES